MARYLRTLSNQSLTHYLTVIRLITLLFSDRGSGCLMHDGRSAASYTAGRFGARADTTLESMEDSQRDVSGSSMSRSGIASRRGRNGANLSSKGYELSEDEVRISLADFRQNYGDPLGGPECAVQRPHAFFS